MSFPVTSPPSKQKQYQLLLLVITILLVVQEEEETIATPAKVAIAPTIPRQRQLVADIFEQLGPYYTRRAFRMQQTHFYQLHRLLLPHLQKNYHVTRNQQNGARNGRIPSSSRLAVALRYFAGGSAYDLSVMFGMSVKEIYRSVWLVVDAVNNASELKIEFPADHNAQRLLSSGFCERSSAQIACCVGAIDGLLIWLEKPSPHDCEIAKCGLLKFMCGRKKNMG